jgi:hypothetical protein
MTSCRTISKKKILKKIKNQDSMGKTNFSFGAHMKYIGIIFPPHYGLCIVL